MFSDSNKRVLLRKGKKEAKRLVNECFEVAEEEIKVTLSTRQKLYKNFILYPYYRYKVMDGVMAKVKDGIAKDSILDEEGIERQISSSKGKLLERKSFFNVYFAVDNITGALTKKLEEDYMDFTDGDKNKIKAEALTIVNAYNNDGKEINDDYVSSVIEGISSSEDLGNIVKRKNIDTWFSNVDLNRIETLIPEDTESEYVEIESIRLGLIGGKEKGPGEPE